MDAKVFSNQKIRIHKSIFELNVYSKIDFWVQNWCLNTKFRSKINFCLQNLHFYFSGTHNLFYAVACFLLARGAELSDKLVYKWTLQTVGGHVLKHIFASISVFFIYRYAKKRVPMERPIYYLYEIKPIRKVIDFSRRIYQIFKRN